MKKKLSVLPALVLSVSLLAGCGAAGLEIPVTLADPPGVPTEAPLRTEAPASPTAAPEQQTLSVRAAADYSEIYAALTAAQTAVAGGAYRAYSSSATRAGGVAEEMAADAGAPVQAPAPTANEAGYSGTNVQVAGIDEGDIVKTDGAYIYVLNRGTADDEGNRDYRLTIVRADGENSAVVSSTRIGWNRWESDDDNDRYAGYSSENKYPTEMFVSDGKLAVLSNYSNSREWYEDGGTGEWKWEHENYLCVDFYDVSDPAAPALIAALGQDGNLTGSRLLDGKLYVISSYWVWDYDEGDVHTYVPAFYRNGAAEAVAADCVFLCGDSTRYVVAGCYDFADASLTASQSLLGSGEEIYMSGENLYVLGSEWKDEITETRTESVYTVTEHTNSAATNIYRFDLSGGGLALAADGSVPGYIDSQFSADERDGYLRIVTTFESSRCTVYEDEAMGFTNTRWPEEQPKSSNGLYVLDMALDTVGSLTGLAEEEYVYSVRFDGDVAYFCTYRQVDPLFTVDVSDPAHPALLSALKISGFSEYLHAWTENRLFGFGQEADEDTGRTEGLKLVMFDTSDKADVTAAHVYALEDLYYSEALYNHKAFFIDPAKNIIGFVGDGGEYYIFSYDEDAGFTELCHFWFDTKEYNVRGLWIGDTAYLVGQEEIMVVDMDTWGTRTGINIAG